ncbi:MAG: DsbA family protein [Acidobacteriota bacterium]
MSRLAALSLTVLLAPALATAQQSPVVATLDGAPITRAELEGRLKSRLLKVRQQEYDILNEGLRELAYARAQEREAARQGISVAALYKKNVTDRVAAPAKSEVDSLLNRFRSQLPPDEAQARTQIEAFLRERAEQERADAYRNELLAKANLKVILEPPRAEVVTAPNDPTIGRADAPITVIEFSDFQCPYCERGQAVVKQLRGEYGDKVRFVFKQLPLPMHGQARLAAEASLCANDQGKYWELREWMYANQSKISTDGLKAAAAELKLNPGRFATCLDGTTHEKRIDEDMAQANGLGATGTPTFFVNGRMLEGAQRIETFREVIDQELARAAAR